jgi:hypothetical protein
MVKHATAPTGSTPVELRPRTDADGRTDVASLRWTIEHMYGELAGTPELARVRDALAIALLEIDRAKRLRMAIKGGDLSWSRYFPWTPRP